MKILITGGCGFLGSNIAASYLEEGAEVIIIDALFRNGARENLNWLREKAQNGPLIHYEFDLADFKAVSEIFEKHAPFNYVCHLGGQVAMTTSLIDPRRDFQTNALGTFNILEAIRALSPGAFLAYSSTNKVYGDMTQLRYLENETRYTVPAHPDGFDESIPLDFASPYGCSKGSADQYVRDWHRNFGLKTVVFRHSSIYGGRQFSTFDQGWIGWFCQKALEQRRYHDAGKVAQPFTIAGTGKQVRDVLHADDLVLLYRAAFEKRDSVAGEAFNIGGGLDNSLSLLELFAMLSLEVCSGRPLLYQRLPRRQSDQNFFVADIRKARLLLNWTPTVNSLQGIRRMIAWIYSQS